MTRMKKNKYFFLDKLLPPCYITYRTRTMENIMNDETIKQLIRLLMKDSNISYRLRENLYKALGKDTFLISWCVDDMMEVIKDMNELSRDIGEPEGYSTDRDVARRAMEVMFENHDCEIGISWQTFQVYAARYLKTNLLEEE